MIVRLAALIGLVLIVHGCASPSATGRRDSSFPSQTPDPTIPEQEVEAGQPFIPPYSGIPKPIETPPTPPPSFPKSAGEISGQAVVSLMNQSNEAKAAGKLDLAASLLERAQRIEPRNYFVWSALAKVYLDQEQFEQAVSVAGKSNSLARGNVYVELENWKTIATARRSKGDSIGALQAEARIDEIERLLSAGS